jgi:hypothetical protein
MNTIRRIFPLQSEVGAIEYAIVAAGVFLAISAVVTVRWLVIS